MVRVHYYSPYTADFNADLLLNRGVRGTAAQRDLKGWYANWAKLQPRLAGRGRGVINEYTAMYRGPARKRTFRRVWRTAVENAGDLENLPRPLRRVGYWPILGNTAISTWKKYTGKMFNSLVKFYSPNQLYTPLATRVNNLIYKRAWQTAIKGNSLIKRTDPGRRRARVAAPEILPPPPPPPPPVAPAGPRRSSRIRNRTQRT